MQKVVSKTKTPKTKTKDPLTDEDLKNEDLEYEDLLENEDPLENAKFLMRKVLKRLDNLRENRESVKQTSIRLGIPYYRKLTIHFIKCGILHPGYDH